MAKEGYKPTSGMQSAARRAIKLKEQGKAKGAGTAVGWTRAGQLARGETLSLSTVKRMYSFFSRHEVDKKGKDFNNAENPSNGKIMWLAWGGDAGFSWSRKIANREKNMKKSIDTVELTEEIKDILVDVLDPAEIVIEIEDDQEDLEKAKDKFKEVIKPRKGEPSDKKLYAKIIAEAKAKFDVYPSAYANGWVVQEYKRRGGKYNVSKAEGLEAGFSEDELNSEFEDSVEKKYENCGCSTCKKEDVICKKCSKCSKEMDMGKAEDISDEDISKTYDSDNEDEDKWDNIQKACWSGYKQVGMKDKNGRRVPNCVPVKKSIFGTDGPQKIIPKNK